MADANGDGPPKTEAQLRKEAKKQEKLAKFQAKKAKEAEQKETQQQKPKAKENKDVRLLFCDKKIIFSTPLYSMKVLI